MWCAECQVSRALDLGHGCAGLVMVDDRPVECGCTDDHLPAGDVALASLIDEQHRDGRTCAQCRPDGCELLEWSRPRLAAFRRVQAARRR